MTDLAHTPAADRAYNRAQQALAQSGNYDEADPYTTLVDLMADLMTWAARNDVDFEDVIEQASHHFVCETIVPDDIAKMEEH